MEWVWLIIVGAIVGALGRLFNPGRDPMGWIVTILLGIAIAAARRPDLRRRAGSS